MKMKIKEIQSWESKMLEEIMRISIDNEIFVFAGAGTALGAVRHGGPIPWDSDADVYVPIDDFPKLCIALKNNLSKDFVVNAFEATGENKILYGKVGLKGFSDEILHVDIFPTIGLPSDEDAQKHFIRKVCRLKWVHYYRTHKLSKRHFLQRLLCKLIPCTNMFLRNKYKALINTYPYQNSEYVFNANSGVDKPKSVRKSILGNGVFVDYAGFRLRIPEYYDKYLSNAYGDYMALPPVEARNKLDRVFEIEEKKNHSF